MSKYIKICPSCYFYDKKAKVCDMCSQGHPHAINNHGSKPKEVKRCDVYWELLK